MPVINGVYLKDFPALPSAVADANIIPIAIAGNQIAYKTTVAGIVTDARVTSKLLTGLSVTGSTILATDTILQAFGKVQNQLNGKVSSVGLTMPAAFNVANSPITSVGTLAVTAAGLASQYIRGDGALADFPTTGGGGSSVSYYLNGSVSQGTFVGNTYYEMNKTPVIGTGTDFSIASDGYIAQFITDANDPASLLIPGGNWNVEMYFSASSSGGNPSFYVEVYKYDGTTFTLLGSSSATPEGITNGTAIDIYYTSVGIPETVLTITDRLAIRVYVTHSGRTITLHTEDNHLSEIVTTFSNGLTALNGLTKQTQYFAVGSTGTDFNISSSVDTHTFNLPTASASNRGALSSANWTTFNNKQDTITLTTTGSSGAATFIANTLNIPNYGSALSGYLPLTGGTLSTTNTSETLRIANGGTGYALYVQSNSYFQGDVTFQSVANSLLKTVSGLLTAAVAGTDYLTPTGSGTGLSGVVLTTTAQTITGVKTFNSGIVTNTTSTVGVTATSTTNNAIQGSATTGSAIYGSTTGTGTAIFGYAFGQAIAGSFTNSTTSLPTLFVKQDGTANVAQFQTPTANVIISNNGSISGVNSLTLSGTISNGTYTYTLPSATGTLALTSALSSYLPLSGGTLTGALSGTSATFSQGISADVGSATSSIQVRNASTDAPFIGFYRGGTLRNTLQLLTDGSFKLTDASLVANAGLTMGALSGTSATFSGDLTIDTNTLYVDSTNNRVGIGTASPGSILDVQQSNATNMGISFMNTFGATSNTAQTVDITSKLVGSGLTGQVGSMIRTGKEGDYSSGAARDAYMSFSTAENDALVERMRITSGGNVQIGGTTNNNGNISINSTNPVLSFGTSSSGPDTALVGTAGGANYHISGSATGDFCIRPIATGNLLFGTSASAGAASNIRMTIAPNGSVTIAGSLSKGSGSFRIEHPLPSLSKTHQLVHSFVEAPQADLIYRGKLTLVNGKAKANIDEVSTMTEGTFEVLCREVQCFTTNESGWDLVKGKVIGNIIYIESQNENSTDEISWMVIGERKDKHMMDTEWTDENGKVIVEPLKPIEPEPMVDLTEVVKPIIPTDNLE